MKIAIVDLITRTPLSRTAIPEILSNREAMIVKFAERLQSRRFHVDLYISDAFKPEREDVMGVPVTYLPTSLKSVFPPGLIPFTPSLYSHLKGRYDAVICSEAFQWGTIFSLCACIFTFRKRAKVIIWQEMAAHQRLFRRIPSVIFHRCVLRYLLDRFVYVYVPRGERARQFLISQGVNREKIAGIIAHGIDPAKFFHDPSAGKEGYIFSPSRLVESKGIDVLLKAYQIVRNDGCDVKLVIQGDGPGYPEYKGLVRALGIERHVVFNRDRLSHDAMRTLYQGALCTVISSRSDLMIFSAQESIACGTPVVLSAGVDFSSEFSDGRGGLVFKNGDWHDLSMRLISLIRNDGYRRAMGKSALEKSALYTNEAAAGGFEKILRSPGDCR